MLRMLKIVPLIFALAAFAIFATGCGTDHAKVRVVHASPDALNLDVAVDGKTVVTDLAFGGLSPATDYLTVTAGNRRVEFRNTGTTTDVINSTVGFGNQKEYTLLAIGLANPTPSTIAALLKTDDNSPPPSGNFKLRLIHAAPDEPANVDIYVVAQGTNISGMSPTISGLAYGQASDYETGAAASMDVIITKTTDQLPIIDQPYDLTSGQIRTLVFMDEGPGVDVIPILLALSDLN